MYVSLPLFEAGDRIEAHVPVPGSKSRISCNYYVISQVFVDNIITKCGKSIYKEHVYIIHKSYGMSVINPKFYGFRGI